MLKDTLIIRKKVAYEPVEDSSFTSNPQVKVRTTSNSLIISFVCENPFYHS